jgi:hypothetical protein
MNRLTSSVTGNFRLNGRLSVVIFLLMSSVVLFYLTERSNDLRQKLGVLVVLKMNVIQEIETLHRQISDMNFNRVAIQKRSLSLTDRLSAQSVAREKKIQPIQVWFFSLSYLRAQMCAPSLTPSLSILTSFAGEYCGPSSRNSCDA